MTTVGEILHLEAYSASSAKLGGVLQVYQWQLMYTSVSSHSAVIMLQLSLYMWWHAVEYVFFKVSYLSSFPVLGFLSEQLKKSNANRI